MAQELENCPICGAPFPVTAAAEGMCPGCLLKMGLDAAVNADTPTVILDGSNSGNRPLVGAVEGPGALIGRYKLLEQIGEGGFGIVYLAQQNEPVKRQVAIKILKPGMDTREIVARFEAERQALALMEHPNIARVFDGGETVTGRPYFVMELVKGMPITKYCNETKLTTRQRLELFLDVLAAVQHAHQKGIIHRDLKPSNIMVSPHDGKPVVKVIDFGIAKAMSLELTDKTLFTATGRMIGTPEYMSPEQTELNALDVDTRSDLYSIGVVLYELLTGRTPLDSRKLRKAGYEEIQRLIREEEPSRPSTRVSTLGEDLPAIAQQHGTDPAKLGKQLRGDLDWIVMKALEKERERRYETANGFADDIRRHLVDEPVSAGPPSRIYRLRKLLRKNLILVSAVSTVALTLCVGLGLIVWQSQEAIVAKEAAVESSKAEAQQRIIAEGALRVAQADRVKAETSEKQTRRLLYAANMNLIQQAWEKPNVRLLHELLNLTKESSEPGFEWYYWQRQVHRDTKTLRGHSSALYAVAISPDGQRVVTGSGDNTARIWDMSTGKELFNLEGHRSRVEFAAISPDGRRVITSCRREMKIWDLRTGGELSCNVRLGEDDQCVAISPDGTRIATGSLWGPTTIRDLETGRELLSLTGEYAEVIGVAFSPDGQQIATRHVESKRVNAKEHSINVWNAKDGKKLLSIHTDHLPRINNVFYRNVVFSPDGARIIATHLNGIYIWNAVSGREILTVQPTGSSIEGPIAFLSNGDRLIGGCVDSTLRVWSAINGDELLVLKGHSSSITAIATSRDSGSVVTVSTDQSAKIWNLSFSPNQILKGHRLWITSLAVSSNGRLIATGSSDATVKLWDVATGAEMRTIRSQRGAISFVGFSSDTKKLLTSFYAEYGFRASIWNTDTGKELIGFTKAMPASNAVTFFPDGVNILAAAQQEVLAFDPIGGNALYRIPMAEEKGKMGWYAVAFSRDGSKFAASTNKVVKIFSISGKELLAVEGSYTGACAVAFAPDGKRIVAAWESTAWISDAQTGQHVLTLRGHSNMIRSVAFSPDNQRVLTCSIEGAKLWDAISGRELLTLKGPTPTTSSASFSPDGRRIVTGHHDGTATVWETATPEQVANWQEEERAIQPR